MTILTLGLGPGLRPIMGRILRRSIQGTSRSAFDWLSGFTCAAQRSTDSFGLTQKFVNSFLFYVVSDGCAPVALSLFSFFPHTPRSSTPQTVHTNAPDPLDFRP